MKESAQDRRVKTALDETRLLILGAQILFGFHLNSAFQTAFAELPASSRALHAASFLLMAAAVALLIAPSLQHQIVEGGRATPRIVAAAAGLAAAALLPFALSLGIDLYILFSLRFGGAIGVATGFACARDALIKDQGERYRTRHLPKIRPFAGVRALFLSLKQKAGSSLLPPIAPATSCVTTAP